MKGSDENLTLFSPPEKIFLSTCTTLTAPLDSNNERQFRLSEA